MSRTSSSSMAKERGSMFEPLNEGEDKDGLVVGHGMGSQLGVYGEGMSERRGLGRHG